MENVITARFEIRTQNVRDNKHISAIYKVLEGYGLKSKLQYVHQTNSHEIRGAAICGKFPASVVEEINALPIPKSAKLGGAAGWSA